MPDKIKKIKALEILDSRGDPTIQVSVELSNGLIGIAKVPSGASTGSFEAFELRDEDDSRYEGKGVLKAVDNVNNIINKELNGIRVVNQKEIDDLLIKLDGTENKSKLGANAILGVSLAIAVTASKSIGIPLYKYLRSIYDKNIEGYKLPIPVVNVINGGAHASTNINIQEFWIIPIKAKTFSERLRQSSEVFHSLGNLLDSIGYNTDLGNEGGYAPDVKSHREVFDFLYQAIENSGYTEKDIVFGIDVGANELYKEDIGTYEFNLDKSSFKSKELINYYLELINNYPLQFIEDPFAEEDWDTWKEFSNNINIKDEIKLIGDDLFVTNISRFKKGIDLGIANTILIKPNQIGTLTETFAAIKLAQDNNYSVIISHRSGETNDTFIADLAVAVNADYIKTGSIARGERISKYNRLLNIEVEL